MNASLVVRDPGLFATIQDLGRWGYLRYGVSNGGAMDRISLQIANMLVGNHPGEGAIEFTAIGGTYEVAADVCRVAIVGGEFHVTIDGEEASCLTSYTLCRGSQVVIGSSKTGLRGYLAVSGGFDLPPTLGSLSTLVHYELGGIDGKPLAAGSNIPLRKEALESKKDTLLDSSLLPTKVGPIRVVMGPQEDYFTDTGKNTFLSSHYTITLLSDRMGYRLDGPEIEHSCDYNIVSDGIAPGSIQVPGTGKPIVLLADRQTTGGYPKIATVITADLSRLGQMTPGEVIHFKAISIKEAESEYIQMNRFIGKIPSLLEPVDPEVLKSRHLMSVNLIDGVWRDK